MHNPLIFRAEIFPEMNGQRAQSRVHKAVANRLRVVLAAGQRKCCRMVTYGTENISCATVQTPKTQIFVGNTAFRAHILHTGQSRHECYPAVRQEPLAQLSGRAEESHITGNEQRYVLFCALYCLLSQLGERADLRLGRQCRKPFCREHRLRRFQRVNRFAGQRVRRAHARTDYGEYALHFFRL